MDSPDSQYWIYQIASNNRSQGTDGKRQKRQPKSKGDMEQMEKIEKGWISQLIISQHPAANISLAAPKRQVPWFIQLVVTQRGKNFNTLEE